MTWVSGCAFYSQTKTLETDLSPHVMMEETLQVKWYPYAGYAGEEGTCFLPLLPSKIEKVINQSIYFNERKIWSIDFPFQQRDDRYTIHVSPDEHAIYIEHFYHEKPSLIVHVETGEIVQLQLPEYLQAVYTYPLQFLEWSEDCSTLKVITLREYLEHDSEPWLDNAIWSVMVSTGEMTKISGDSEEKTDSLNQDIR